MRYEPMGNYFPCARFSQVAFVFSNFMASVRGNEVPHVSELFKGPTLS